MSCRPANYRYDPSKQQGRRGIGKGQWIRLRLWRQSKHCLFCGKHFPHPDDATIEHLFPREFGGTYKLSNLALTCYECNHERNTFYQRHFKRLRKRRDPRLRPTGYARRCIDGAFEPDGFIWRL